MSDLYAYLGAEHGNALKVRPTTPPLNHDTAPAVLDSDAHQVGVDFSKLSVNGKRHAKAMIAGLLRLEAGAT